MKSIEILSVAFSVLTLVISFVPNRCIHQAISHKPPASKTLVDLIYKVIDRLVEMMNDRVRLVERIDRMQINQVYFEDSGGEYL